mgnify:FL=1
MTLGLLIALLTLVVAGMLFFQPIPVNFFRYLIWLCRYRGPKTRGRVERAEGKIAFRVYGEGSPIVFLHRGLSSSIDWFSQIPVFISQKRRLILVDARGHGLSTLGRAKFNYINLAEDVLAVLDHLEISRSDIVGWSDGGNTALRLAELFPSRVNRIESF